jgi:hypothetical protein
MQDLAILVLLLLAVTLVKGSWIIVGPNVKDRLDVRRRMRRAAASSRRATPVAEPAS